MERFRPLNVVDQKFENLAKCGVFYCLKFTCSQDSLREGLDADSR